MENEEVVGSTSSDNTSIRLILAPFYGIRHLLPGIMNIIILVLIALAWKHLPNENLPHKQKKEKKNENA